MNLHCTGNEAARGIDSADPRDDESSSTKITSTVSTSS